MTQEDKELLLKDLCARLPYGVKVVFDDGNPAHKTCDMTLYDIDNIWLEKVITGHGNFIYDVEYIKPYLRPMTSMTYEEETYAMRTFFDDSDNYTIDDVGDIFTEQQPYESVYTLSLQRLCKYMSWLLSKHFDINHLIEKGLALEVPTDMYTIDNQ